MIQYHLQKHLYLIYQVIYHYLEVLVKEVLNEIDKNIYYQTKNKIIY